MAHSPQSRYPLQVVTHECLSRWLAMWQRLLDKALECDDVGYTLQRMPAKPLQSNVGSPYEEVFGFPCSREDCESIRFLSSARLCFSLLGRVDVACRRVSG